MALPVLKFNNSTGHDDNSGAGPGDGDISGSLLSGTSASYSGLVITLDGSPDLSNVTTDGTSVILLQTSTGREYFTINAKDDGADTVTVDQTISGTTTGLSWRIGGKRLGINSTRSRQLLETDLEAEWEVEIEETGTNYTLTSDLPFPDGIRFTIRGTGSSNPIIEQTINGDTFSLQSNVFFYNLDFINTNATKSGDAAAISQNGSDAEPHCFNCTFGSTVSADRLNRALYRSAAAAGAFHLINCVVQNTVSVGVAFGGSTHCRIIGCKIVDCGSDGLQAGSSAEWVIDNTIIADNGGNGINNTNTNGADYGFTVSNCTIHGNIDDGIEIDGSSNHPFKVYNCSITGNGGFGIHLHSSQVARRSYIDHNNYGTGGTANSSGPVSDSYDQGDNSINLDPGYVDAANHNFSPGENNKAAGTPGNFHDGTSTGYMDIGAVQRREGAGQAWLIKP